MTLGYRKREAHYEPYFSECSRPRRMFMEETEQYLVRYTEFFLRQLKSAHLKKTDMRNPELQRLELMKLDWKKARMYDRETSAPVYGMPVPGGSSLLWSASFFRRCAGHRYETDCGKAVGAGTL